MTFIIVVLLGAGVIFVASSLDNTPIVQTFQKIISGEAVDWTGSGATQPIAITGATNGNCTLKPNASLTDIETFCQCVSIAGTMSYAACLKQYAS